MGATEMATKAKQTHTKRSKPKKVEFAGYINHNITQAEKDAFEKWCQKESVESTWAMLERLVDSGYKFSTKTDHYGGGVQASLLCDDVKNEDAGLCLVARAPDLYNAILLLMFKHFDLLGGSWVEYHEINTEPSMWG
jgi:hypothetical protein